MNWEPVEEVKNRGWRVKVLAEAPANITNKAQMQRLKPAYNALSEDQKALCFIRQFWNDGQIIIGFNTNTTKGLFSRFLVTSAYAGGSAWDIIEEWTAGWNTVSGASESTSQVNSSVTQLCIPECD
jgi:hypothetical protein